MTDPVELGLETRRRRLPTACTTCRDRRVKCDRAKPRCLRCARANRSCAYVTAPASAIEFVQPRGLEEYGASAQPSARSETWKSLMEQQGALINQPQRGKGISQEISHWPLTDAVGEEQRASEYQNTQHVVPPGIQISEILLDYPFVPISSLREDFTSSLWTKLPPKDICLSFFESFLSTVHPAIPLCHAPTLGKIYFNFWEGLSSGTSAEVLLLILAITYTGATASCRIEASALSTTLYELYNQLAHELDISSYYVTQSPSAIMLLQGVLIFNTVRASSLAPFRAYGFLPAAIRFAQSLELDVDHTRGNYVDQEAKRRLWWHLVYLDEESTIASGLPPIIALGSHTTRRPSMLWASTITAVRGDAASPMTIAMCGHWEWTHHMQVWLQRKPEQHEIVQFNQIIENLLNMIGAGRESEWAYTYLQMLIDRAYCMLGLRSWQLDLFKGIGCHCEVIKTARSFLERFLRLANLSQSLGFSWFIPGLVQPLHALIIILVHLDGCVCPEEECILSRDLIDQVFHVRLFRIMDGSRTPVSFAPKHFNNLRQHNLRYLALSKLKSRVWQKLSWSATDWHSSRERVEEDRGVIKSYDDNTLQTNSSATSNNEHRVLDMSLSALWDEFADGVPLAAEMTDWDEWSSFSAGFPID